MTFLIFIFAVFGLVEIIIQGKPTAPIRKLFSLTKIGKEFIHCPLCLGFWVGLVLGFWLMPSDFWKPRMPHLSEFSSEASNVSLWFRYVSENYLTQVLGGLFNGFIGSGTAFFLHSLSTPPDFGIED